MQRSIDHPGALISLVAILALMQFGSTRSDAVGKACELLAALCFLVGNMWVLSVATGFLMRAFDDRCDAAPEATPSVEQKPRQYPLRTLFLWTLVAALAWKSLTLAADKWPAILQGIVLLYGTFLFGLILIVPPMYLLSLCLGLSSSPNNRPGDSPPGSSGDTKPESSPGSLPGQSVDAMPATAGLPGDLRSRRKDFAKRLET